MFEVLLKRFDEPDEVREFPKGRFETVTLGPMTIGRATYQPGWRWSMNVGPGLGEEYCTVEHVGMVLSGAATAAFADGRVTEMRAGDLFYIPSEPHDSWVVGEEPYVSLHFLGAGEYAAAATTVPLPAVGAGPTLALVRVFSTDDRALLNAARTRLDEAGIPYEVSHEEMAGGEPGSGAGAPREPSRRPASIEVSESLVLEAERILEGLDRS